MSCENGIPGAGGSANYTAANLGGAKGGDGKTPQQRAMEIIDFFKDKQFGGKQFPIEFAIALAGVWGAESGIKTWSYNEGEQSRGGFFVGKHTNPDKKITYGGTTYECTEENMRKFGYGKGVAQWSWDRPLKFRDWYNSSEGVKTNGIPTMDTWASAITATSVATQTGFAWFEMQKRTGEFMTIIKGVNHASHTTNNDKFKENIKTCVDAITRGFENGSTTTMAKISWMESGYAHRDKNGNKIRNREYWGEIFKPRYEWALGVYDKIKGIPEYQRYLE